MNYKPRFINWLYALTHAYFWLPCPICGKNFGGHESKGMLMQGWNGGVSVCPKCAEEADRRNNIFMANNKPTIRIMEM